MIGTLELRIGPELTVAELQKQFNDAFPCLKLVFFRKKHEAYEGSAVEDMIKDPNASLGALSTKVKEAVLLIEPTMPTWQLERLFEAEHGLHVQLFRQSGNLWLETSRTDDLSIEQQNAKGEASMRHHFPLSDPLDYREQP